MNMTQNCVDTVRLGFEVDICLVKKNCQKSPDLTLVSCTSENT